MAVNLLILVILFLFAVLFALLFRRSWKARSLPFKVAGITLSGILVLIFTLITVLVAVGFYQVYAPRGNPVVETTVQITPERVARGEQIANFICSSCHSTTEAPPLSGGHDLADEIPIPLGQLTPPNLTPAGPLKDWSDGQIIRAIREGTNNRGHLLPVMASQSFRHMSDEDIASVVAYLRSQPPIENVVPEENVSTLALAFVTLGFIPLPELPEPGPVPAVAKGATVEWGHYLVNVTGCSECHGKDLSGGAGGLLPKGPSLRVVKSWSEAEFKKAMQSGVNPAGEEIDPDQMPWKYFGRMEDRDLGGIYAYLRSLD